MKDDQTGVPTRSYASTHCRQCAAGWTRRKADGGIVTVCLLDRAAVMIGLTDCDRYEPRLPPS